MLCFNNFPTVEVSVSLFDQMGQPLRDVTISAKLSTLEKYNGFVLPSTYKAVTDSDGKAVLEVFPNELGTEGSEYQFKLTPSCSCYGTEIINAFVPNRNCALSEIATLEGYRKLSSGEQITSCMLNMKDETYKNVCASQNWAEGSGNPDCSNPCSRSSKSWANAVSRYRITFENNTITWSNDAGLPVPPQTVIDIDSMKGETGESFEYKDFTEEQLQTLKGKDGVTFIPEIIGTFLAFTNDGGLENPEPVNVVCNLDTFKEDIEKKVDKEEGKILSDNNFTNEYRLTLDELESIIDKRIKEYMSSN